MQPNNGENIALILQALWDNLVINAMDIKAYTIIIYDYPGNQTVYLQNNDLKDHGYHRFQADNVFLEKNFDKFSEYVYSKLNINRNPNATPSVAQYENIKFTYSYSQQGRGEFVYIGIPANKPAPTLHNLGFTKPQLDEILNTISKSSSGILVCGTTGCGKTSTVSHLVNEISKNHTIVTIDDSENCDVGYILRSDIDSISIGELRTPEHVRDFSKLREVGCQVIGTIHANSPLQSLDRLNLLAGKNIHRNVDLIIHQTLIKKLCPYCSIGLNSISEHLDNSETAPEFNYYNGKEQLHLKLKKLYQDVDLSRVRVKSHNGCEICNHNGVNGLTICASVIPTDPRMHELIDEKEDVGIYLRLMADEDPLSDNMAGKSAKEHAVYHMLTGIIDPEDVYEKFSYL